MSSPTPAEIARENSITFRARCGFVAPSERAGPWTAHTSDWIVYRSCASVVPSASCRVFDTRRPDTYELRTRTVRPQTTVMMTRRRLPCVPWSVSVDVRYRVCIVHIIILLQRVNDSAACQSIDPYGPVLFFPFQLRQGIVCRNRFRHNKTNARARAVIKSYYIIFSRFVFDDSPFYSHVRTAIQRDILYYVSN